MILVVYGSFFNKKSLVCRKTTERPDSVGLTSFLIDSPDNLFQEFSKHVNSFSIEYESPYGDGYSSKKIVEKIV